MADVDIKTDVNSILSTTVADMKAGSAPTALYTVPTGMVERTIGYCVRDPTATLAGGTSYSVTNFKQTVDLSSMTATTDYMFIDGNNAKYTHNIADAVIYLTKTTGSTGTANATIDLFGYIKTAP